MIAAVRDEQGLIAVQRIFLDIGRPGKHLGKAVLGSLQRGCWRGYVADNHLALAEGVETAIAYQQITGLPTWATFGGGRLATVAIPPTVQRLVIVADNDRAGRQFAQAAATTWRRTVPDVSIDAPPAPYGDWADLARAAKGEGEGGR